MGKYKAFIKFSLKKMTFREACNQKSSSLQNLQHLKNPHFIRKWQNAYCSIELKFYMLCSLKLLNTWQSRGNYHGTL